MNITQLQLASSIAANENNEVLNNDTVIYFGALIGFITALLVLIIKCIFKKNKSQISEPTFLEVTI